MRVVPLLPSATEARDRRVVSTSVLPEGLTPSQVDAVVRERLAAGEDLHRLDAGALAGLEAAVVLTHHHGADSRRIAWDDVAGAGADVVLVALRSYSLEPAGELAAAVVAGGRTDGAAVWAVDADSDVVRPGPRLVAGAELVGQIVHPDGCGPPDPDRARRIA